MENKKFEDLTTEDFKEIKIEFAPGCFDNFDGTQEELDELVAHIKNMITSGDISENSRQLSEEDFEELPEEIQEQLFNAFDDESNNKRTLN